MTVQLGYSAVPAGTDTNGPGIIVASGSNFVPTVYETDGVNLLATAAYVYYLGTFTGGSGQTQKCRICLFLDNGSNAPTTTLAGVSDPITISQTSAAGYYSTTTFANYGPVILQPNTLYWVAVWFGTESTSGDDFHIGYYSGTGINADQYYQTGVTYSDTANPVVSSWLNAGNVWVYGSYFDMNPLPSAPSSVRPSFIEQRPRMPVSVGRGQL